MQIIAMCKEQPAASERPEKVMCTLQPNSYLQKNAEMRELWSSLQGLYVTASSGHCNNLVSAICFSTLQACNPESGPAHPPYKSPIHNNHFP